MTQKDWTDVYVTLPRLEASVRLMWVVQTAKLSLTVNRNPLGRNLIQVGLNATSNFEGKSSYSVLGRITRKPIGPRGGDISLSGEFGTNIGLSAELYQPFGRGGEILYPTRTFRHMEPGVS